MRVLLSAYACEPGKGSEPEVGWQWAIALAQLHEVTVLTRANNQGSITGALAKLPGPHPKFEYYDLPHFLVRCKKAGMPISLYYLLWQIGVRWHFRKRLSDFDIIHHLTFNSFRQPGFWWFCGKPVVLGPLGGGQICPWRFLPLMRGRRVAEIFRSISVIIAPAFPHIIGSFAAASKILVANADTARRIPGLFRSKVVHMLETGIPEMSITPAIPRRDETAVRILWFSSMIPIKAPALALRALALAQAAHPNLRLTMAGDGPLRPHMESLAIQLGVSNAVCWKGRIAKTDVPNLMKEHDIFVFTSIRDTSGNVLLEAMAAGLPSVTLLHQGAAEIATEETAIRVAVSTMDETIDNLAKGLIQLADSRKDRMRMGEAALSRVRNLYEWTKKARRMSAIYLNCR